MKAYRIESDAGIILGEYTGSSEEEALEYLWSDANAAVEDRTREGLLVIDITPTAHPDEQLDLTEYVIYSDEGIYMGRWYASDEAHALNKMFQEHNTPVVDREPEYYDVFPYDHSVDDPDAWYPPEEEDQSNPWLRDYAGTSTC